MREDVEKLKIGKLRLKSGELEEQGLMMMIIPGLGLVEAEEALVVGVDCLDQIKLKN